MHTLGHIGIAIVAIAALLLVVIFAKRQMGYWFWQSGPSDPPVTRGGTGTGGTPQPPK